MNRRGFLFNSASFLAGSLFGLNGISRAFSFSGSEKGSSPRIAIIIDDIGYTRSQARRFLQLGVPITFSILPRLQKTRDLAVEIHEHGHEIMLHQPMEPHNSRLNPGPGALYVGDKTSRITETVEANIADVPHALGVNNHMGSRLTECRAEMGEVLNVIEDNSLFFVDSYTSSRSVAYSEANRRQLPSAFRNIFLDNKRNEDYITNQLKKLHNHARKYGHAIGIGHPFPETSRAISRFLARPEKPSDSLVHMSRILAA